jgi:hypothetical protein
MFLAALLHGFILLPLLDLLWSKNDFRTMWTRLIGYRGWYMQLLGTYWGIILIVSDTCLMTHRREKC